MMDSFFDSRNLISLLIGLMVSVVIIVAFRRGLGSDSSVMRRAAAVFAGLAGFMVYMVLRDDQVLFRKYSTEIVIALVGVLLAFLVFLRRQF